MIARLLHRLGKAHLNYRHPLSLLAQRVIGRPVITVADRETGLRFRCRHGADRMLGEIFHSRIYDIPTAPVGRGDVVVDVGANHGFTCCYFAARGAEVVAFEPDPATYPFLTANIAANGLADRIRAFPWAVAGSEGIARLNTADELGGGMSTLHDRFANAIQQERLERDLSRQLTLCRHVVDYWLKHGLPKHRAVLVGDAVTTAQSAKSPLGPFDKNVEWLGRRRAFKRHC